jgi:cullin-associated NEDD8-dissociated protein 1
VTYPETVIKPELISEVDLGPFKHKVDEGIPIRKAAFALLDTLLEKVPERTDVSAIFDVSLKGLDDQAEECMIQCLHIIGRLHGYTPGTVLAHLENLVDAFEKLFGKNMKLISSAQSSEKAQNIMRAILRVVEMIQRNPDSDSNAKFVDFFKTQVMENASSKEMYEKIAATASKAVHGDNY